MGDAAGNYDLKVEFLESNDFIGKKARCKCLVSQWVTNLTS